MDYHDQSKFVTISQPNDKNKSNSQSRPFSERFERNFNNITTTT